MTTLEVKGDWNITKGKLQQKWATLTNDDLQFVEGKQEELIGRIQKRTGETREAVEKALKESGGSCCTPKAACTTPPAPGSAPAATHNTPKAACTTPAAHASPATPIVPAIPGGAKPAPRGTPVAA